VADISDREHAAPPRRLLMLEWITVVGRLWRAFGRVGERGPAGGPPLMVIPGFFASDRSTLGLQRALARAGYRVTGWGMGLNRGAHAGILDDIIGRLEHFARGEPAILVGWSLGGVFAREVAKLRPDLVSRVFTMGSPFSGDPRANNAWRLYEKVAGHPVDRPPIAVDSAPNRRSRPSPCGREGTAWSRPPVPAAPSIRATSGSRSIAATWASPPPAAGSGRWSRSSSGTAFGKRVEQARPRDLFADGNQGFPSEPEAMMFKKTIATLSATAFLASASIAAAQATAPAPRAEPRISGASQLAEDSSSYWWIVFVLAFGGALALAILDADDGPASP
jgi:pimeloyl-ACP methyl ester carboxylesterase